MGRPPNNAGSRNRHRPPGCLVLDRSSPPERGTEGLCMDRRHWDWSLSTHFAAALWGFRQIDRWSRPWERAGSARLFSSLTLGPQTWAMNWYALGRYIAGSLALRFASFPHRGPPSFDTRRSTSSPVRAQPSSVLVDIRRLHPDHDIKSPIVSCTASPSHVEDEAPRGWCRRTGYWREVDALLRTNARRRPSCQPQPHWFRLNAETGASSITIADTAADQCPELPEAHRHHPALMRPFQTPPLVSGVTSTSCGGADSSGAATSAIVATRSLSCQPCASSEYPLGAC